MAINFFSENTDFSFKGKKRKTAAWLSKVAVSEDKETGEISIIFCSDEYLLEINRTHLKHDYFTDIITFDYSEGNCIAGDLFISVDTVRENAANFNTSFEEELNRIMVHGVLHLAGYKDKSPKDAKLMREKENFYLNTLSVK